MPTKRKNDKNKPSDLELRIAKLEKDLNWTRKRLVIWELLLWQFYENGEPVRIIVDGFFKTHCLTELELKATLAQAAATEIGILDRDTGAEKTVLVGDKSDAYWERLETLRDQEPEAFTQAFRDEGGEVYGEVVNGEIESNA